MAVHHFLVQAQGQQVAAAHTAFVGVDWLADEIGRAGIQHLVTGLLVVRHGDHHHRHIFQMRGMPDAGDDLQPRQVIHQVIEQDQVGLVFAEPGHGSHRIGEGRHFDRGVDIFDHPLKDHPAGEFIIDDDHRRL